MFRARVDLTYMGGIEPGVRNPSLLVMARIAKALSSDLSDLLKRCGAPQIWMRAPRDKGCRMPPLRRAAISVRTVLFDYLAAEVCRG